MHAKSLRQEPPFSKICKKCLRGANRPHQSPRFVDVWLIQFLESDLKSTSEHLKKLFFDARKPRNETNTKKYLRAGSAQDFGLASQILMNSIWAILRACSLA